MNHTGKILVQWMTPSGNTVLQQLEVPMVGPNKDRLPLKAIREKWHCGPITWLDVEEVIEEDKNGHSAMAFRGMEKIRVTADKL